MNGTDFDSKDRPLSFWSVHFDTNGRPVWLEFDHFWKDSSTGQIINEVENGPSSY